MKRLAIFPTLHVIPVAPHNSGNENRNRGRSLKIENFQQLSVILIPEPLKYKSRFTISAGDNQGFGFTVFLHHLLNKYVRLIGLSVSRP